MPEAISPYTLEPRWTSGTSTDGHFGPSDFDAISDMSQHPETTTVAIAPGFSPGGLRRPQTVFEKLAVSGDQVPGRGHRTFMDFNEGRDGKGHGPDFPALLMDTLLRQHKNFPGSN